MDEPDRVRFSVVIATYNRSAQARELVEWVLGLSSPPFEVVVVDDGSTDATGDAIRSIEDPRVVYCRRPNGGISAARNTGIAAASGEFLVFLDDDDRPGPTWLEDFDTEIRESAADVVSCGCVMVNSGTGEVSGTRLPEPLGPAFAGYTGLFMAGTFAVRKETCVAVGGFAESLTSSHQTEFSLRLLPACRKNEWVVAHIDRPNISINRAQATSRRERSARRVLSGTEYIIAEHHEQLRLDPALLASYHSVAGVSAARLGSYEVARRHFRMAVRYRPLAARSVGRLVVAWVPPLARRAWGSLGENPLKR